MTCNWYRMSLIAAVLVAGCGDDAGQGDDAGSTTGECVGAKCDVPDDPVELSCEKRRTDAFNPNRLAYTPDALRWSCNDVSEVTLEDRGQEYCEYFATVLPPPADPDQQEVPEAMILGMNQGLDNSYGTTELVLELTDYQIEELTATPDAIVGQCVFTSWNSDVADPQPCESDCDEVLGLPIDESVFRMKFEVNSLDAAITLIEECMEFEPEAGDPDDPDDPLHDDFTRACYLNADLNGTEWRKSDTTICGAAVRLADCGCDTVVDQSVAEALSEPTPRGFPLGGWSGVDDLFPGCHRVATPDGTQSIVTCDLTATEVVMNRAELKEYCRGRYADEVVVHVPVPAAAVTCEPPAEQQYGATCSDQPWVLEDY